VFDGHRGRDVKRMMRLAIIAAGLIAAIKIVVTSLDPTTYFFYRQQDRSRWEYPAFGVGFVVLAVAVETGILYGVLAVEKPGRVWMRGLAALAALLPWGLVVSTFVVHAPGFWLLHLIWVWVLILIIGASVLSSGAVHAYGVLRSNRLGQA
jgi:hypothetical protein